MHISDEQRNVRGEGSVRPMHVGSQRPVGCPFLEVCEREIGALPDEKKESRKFT